MRTKKSYLIYENCPPENTVALCLSISEVARFLCVDRRSVYRYIDGTRSCDKYGIFVDEYDPVTLESLHPLSDGDADSTTDDIYLTKYHKSLILPKKVIS